MCFPGSNKRSVSNDSAIETLQRQFLPAALEIQQRPPSPVGRVLMWLLLALFLLGVLWAVLGEVDIVVTAPGRVIPSGQVKTLQASEAGTVRVIHVSEGDQVAAGQVLISLDPTYADADELRITEQLKALAVQIEWRRALEQWLQTGRDNVPGVEFLLGVSLADQVMANAVFGEHRNEIVARMLGFEKELAANAAEQSSVLAEKSGTIATLAVLSERVEAYGTLLERQYGARVQYLELLQQKTTLEGSIPVMESKQQQLVERALAIAAQMKATEGELRKNNLMELSRLYNEQSALQQESRKAVQRKTQLLLTAPVTGTVHELAVHTIGGVVTSAQALLKIVPQDAAVEVEAMLQNKDIGFVSKGQRAEVKIDAFNFTRYGIIDAKVVDISSDAIEHQTMGWVFKVRLKLVRDHIAVEERMVTLTPGMSITAEVKTGKRRLMEFFLSPLLRYKQESVRER